MRFSSDPWVWIHVHGTRVVLPSGTSGQARLVFDPTQVVEPGEGVRLPGLHAIGKTLEVLPFLVRYLYLDVESGAIYLQKDRKSDDLVCINSSLTTLTSSIGLYEVWAPRLLSTGPESPDVFDAMLQVGVEQLNAVERAMTADVELPRWWPRKLAELGRFL